MFKKFLKIAALSCAWVFPAFAVDKPSLDITAKFLSSFVTANQKLPKSQSTGIDSTGHITFNVMGFTPSVNMNYGFIALLNLDRASSETSRIKAAYFYASSDDLGSAMLGDVDGVNSMMIYDAHDIINGAGGFGGAMWSHVSLSAGVVPIREMIDYGAKRNPSKINYISPSFYGFQIGFSYTPNNQYVGNETKTTSSFAAPFVEDEVQLTAGYSFSYGSFGMGLFAGGRFGNAKATPTDMGELHRLSVMRLGTQADYGPWQFGAGYWNAFHSFVRKDVLQNNQFTPTYGQGYNVALNYNYNAWTFAAGYAGTKRRTNDGGRAKNNVFSGSINYTVNRGLTLYAEADYGRQDTSAGEIALGENPNSLFNQTGLGDNRETVFVLGTQIIL